jgi:hypothetical protein
VFQSATGTDTVKAGVGLTFGPNVTGEKVFGNYFEDYLSMMETQNTSATYQLFYAVGNHNDGCTNPVSDAGAKNYVIEDPVGKVTNANGWSTNYALSTLWKLTSPAGKVGMAMDGNGNCFWGATSGANHLINMPGVAEGGVILTLQGAGSSGAYFSHVTGGTNNAANAGMSIMRNTTTLRSINATGTVNTSGSDYAEYMRKAETCGAIGKGQIVGVDGDGNLTDRWDAAVSFLIKSTDPSFVGGDTWHEGLDGEALEAVAFAGRVPVNVYDTKPGQWIVAAQDGEGITGRAVDEPTMGEYLRAVGRVISVQDDGRAFVIVKPV